MTLPSDWYNNEEKMEAYSLQYLANWTDVFSTQIYAGHVGINDIQAPLHGTDFPEVFVRTPGPNGVYDLGTSTATNANTDDGYIVLGPDFSRQYNFTFYHNNFVKGVADYVLDNHTIKVGVEYHDIGIIDKFIQGAQSVVRFRLDRGLPEPDHRQDHRHPHVGDGDQRAGRQPGLLRQRNRRCLGRRRRKFPLPDRLALRAGRVVRHQGSERAGRHPLRSVLFER